MKKVLFVATVQSHIMNFHIPYLKLWQDKGYEVHVATNMDTKKYDNVESIISDVVWNDIDFDRNPFSKNSFIALKQLVDLMKKNRYELLHVHTPVGGILGRLAAKITNTKNVVYTAHGFHFYKGAPIQNWLIYYPIEKLMARYTDALITINEEDYQLAKNKFKTKIKDNVFKVNGVGVDLNNYKVLNNESTLFKKSIGLDEDDFVVSIIGELNDNKNQIQLIKAVKALKGSYNNLKCLIVGYGENEDYLKKYIIKENLENHVIMLGFRRDIPDILNITDVVVSMSKREGLPKNIMEAMVAGKPIICTNVRGNNDLVENKINGILVDIDNDYNVESAIRYIYENLELRELMSKNNKNKVRQYDIKKVIKDIEIIYSKLNYKQIYGKEII